jgi:hypothetical protein
MLQRLGEMLDVVARDLKDLRDIKLFQSGEKIVGDRKWLIGHWAPAFPASAAPLKQSYF